MLTGYYAFVSIWGSSKIPFRLQKIFFVAIVTSAGPSGLEPFVLTEALLWKLESTHMKLPRRLFRKKGWGARLLMMHMYTL